MDLNKLRDSALKANSSQLLQSGKLGAYVASDTKKILSLSPEEIEDGVTQEKKNFLQKLRAISTEDKGASTEQPE